jgi:hypothetical protein
MNKNMDFPFFVPLRDPKINNAATLADAFLQLAKQSGGRFKLFKTTNQMKIFAVWPLTSKSLFGGFKPKF